MHRSFAISQASAICAGKPRRGVRRPCRATLAAECACRARRDGAWAVHRARVFAAPSLGRTVFTGQKTGRQRATLMIDSTPSFLLYRQTGARTRPRISAIGSCSRGCKLAAGQAKSLAGRKGGLQARRGSCVGCADRAHLTPAAINRHKGLHESLPAASPRRRNESGKDRCSRFAGAAGMPRISRKMVVLLQAGGLRPMSSPTLVAISTLSRLPLRLEPAADDGFRLRRPDYPAPSGHSCPPCRRRCSPRRRRHRECRRRSFSSIVPAEHIAAEHERGRAAGPIDQGGAFFHAGSCHPRTMDCRVKPGNDR